MFESPPFWMYLIGFLLVLGPLVTVHELGHYLVGRWFGVKADAFSVGFGKEIAGFTDRHGTRWKLSALPLGGYVQFKGDMNPASIPDPDKPINPAESEGAFQTAALWKRALIVAAGPVTNLLVAVGIFAAFFVAFGQPQGNTIITAFAAGSPAAEAGLLEGDRVVAIDGEAIAESQDVIDRVIMFPGREISVTVERDGSRTDIPFAIGTNVETDQFGNESKIGRLGIYFDEIDYRPVGVIEATGLALENCWRITVMMVTGIKQVVTGERSIKDLGGPVKIAKYSGERLSLGALPFIEFAALISLNLAFINLLPIPALDGGHLAFYAAEAVRRKPAGPQATEWAYRAGIAVVLALMVVVTVNDLFSLPLFGS